MLARLFASARYLLLLAVLPLTVILTQTQSANAATYGNPVPFSFTQDRGGVIGSGGKVNCTGNAAYAVMDSITMNVLTSIKCSIEIPMSDDPDVGDTIGTTTISLDGADTQGDVENCDSSTTSNGDPVAGIAITVPNFATNCVLSTICVIYDWDQDVTAMFDTHTSGEWCGDISMGTPPGVSASCPLGTPTSVKFSEVPGSGAWAGYEGRLVDVTFALGADNTFSQNWQIEARYPIGGGGPVPDLARAPWFNFATAGPSGQSGSTWIGTHWESRRWIGSDNVWAAEAGDPVGFWIFPLGGGPVAHSAYAYGDNDPAGCHFYFGPKFRDDPNTTKDDPQGLPDGTVIEPGGSTTPPDLTPTQPLPAPAPDCDFSLSDPTTWATAGICALVGLIAKLLDVVGGIAAAILDGLKGLFIPSHGFMDAKLDRLSGIWDDTAPAKYGDALADLTPGQASGCGGVPLNVDLGGGVTIDEHVGAACSGSMASAAGIVKLALSAMLVVGGLLASVRAVGSGFGWDPGLRSAEQ